MLRRPYPIKLPILYDLVIEYAKGNIRNIEDVKKISGTRSDVKARKQLSMVRWFLSVFGQFSGSYTEFLKTLRKYFDEKYKLTLIIEKMSEKKLPVNYISVMHVAKELGVKIERRMARLLLALGEEIGILFTLRITAYTPTEKDRLFNFIKNKGEVRFSILSKRFPNAKNLVLSLWKQNLVSIEHLDPIRDILSEINDFERIPYEILARIEDAFIIKEFFSVWDDPTTGVKYMSLSIPRTIRVRIKW